jgi:ubiquinone/menaquinone biosynthesis C-methylase UbiE
VGVERSRALLHQAKARAQKEAETGRVDFRGSPKRHLAFANEVFDALVSEFVIYPTPLPTEIGQPEMARVLKPGGTMIITDVVLTRPVSPAQRRALRQIGVNYLCEARVTDFEDWMRDACLERIEVADITPTLRRVWLQRQSRDLQTNHQAGYALLLEDQALQLGQGSFYIYAKGVKPPA